MLENLNSVQLLPFLMKVFIKHVVFFSILYAVLFPPKAHAYLDPGTGSYILQIAAAIIFAGLFLIKTWWNHISRFILRILGRKEKSSEKNSSKDK